MTAKTAQFALPAVSAQQKAAGAVGGQENGPLHPVSYLGGTIPLSQLTEMHGSLFLSALLSAKCLSGFFLRVHLQTRLVLLMPCLPL